MTAAPRYSVLELCKNRAGYEAAPDRPLALDLEQVKRATEEAGWETLAEAGIILVSRTGFVEVSIFESGKLLFKTREQERAEQAMREFFGIMGWSP